MVLNVKLSQKYKKEHKSIHFFPDLLCRADTNKAHRVTGQIQVNHSICAAGGFAE